MDFYQLFLKLTEENFNWDGNETDFIKHHKTGDIPSHAYSDYEEKGGLSWIGNKSKYPELILIKSYAPHSVEFRKSGEKLRYVDTDDQGEILRDPNDIALYMSDDKIKQKDLPTHDETIVAFVNDKPIGLASNEWGTIGVWVEKEYQRLGIGSDLMVMFMKNNQNFLTGKKKIGQMTGAGQAMSRAAFRKLKN